MMLIEKALERAELTIEGDVLPKSKRTVKAFKKLISTMRSVEAEMLRLHDADRIALNEQLKLNLELQAECHELRARLAKLELKAKLETLSSLTEADRDNLLSHNAAA